LGLEIAVPEADVRITVDGDAAAAADLERQAEYFGSLVEGCLAVARCRSFTVWGLSDAYSWVPFFFSGEGAATLLDADFATKPAYAALEAALARGR
ncbi:MAG: endo-1,4-beta-xylanase, partial [Actinomycetota bacterium]|nr:endo-1,4-beta-xylanase [Actinomycetota bacterium]